MPRSPRIWFPGAMYHLVLRGNNRQPVFFKEQDYRKYLKYLGEAKQRYACRVIAYVLMTNHVHLMVETGSEHPIWKLMQVVNTAYTMSINKRYN